MSLLAWPVRDAKLHRRTGTGARHWEGKQAEKEAVYANRRRIQGERGKRLQRQRGERIERNFAHQFDTGGMDRLYVRAQRSHKKLLIQAAACNLALLMRSSYGAGKPRAAHDLAVQAIFAILAIIKAVEDLFTPWSANPGSQSRISHRSGNCCISCPPPGNPGFRPGLLRAFRGSPGWMT